MHTIKWLNMKWKKFEIGNKLKGTNRERKKGDK